VRQQQAAGFGRHRSAAVARQQVLPQFHLQKPHLAAECRLGNAEGGGGPRESAQLGHPDEVFDLFEIHAQASLLK